MRLRWTALFAFGLGACSVPTGSPFTGECPLFQLLETSPLQGAEEVSPLAEVRFRFSDFPEPDVVRFPTVTLTSGPYRFTAHSGVDLVRRSVWLVANSPLPTSVQITALATPGLRSLHDCPVYLPPGRDDTLSVLLQFRTAAAVPAAPPDEAPPDETKVTDLFARACAGGCHAAVAPAPPCLAEPDGHLSLCPSEARNQLVGVSSREYAAFLRVAPRDSARSYLLRKLLGAPPALAPHPAALPLGDEDLLTIERWIDAGVPGRAPPS